MSKGGLNDKTQKSVKSSQQDVQATQQLGFIEIPSEQSSKSMRSYITLFNLECLHLFKTFKPNIGDSLILSQLRNPCFIKACTIILQMIWKLILKARI